MESFFTLQGEGMYAGTPAFFIRLAGCDVGCVWCDVKESWDASVHPQIEIDQLVAAAIGSGAPMVVITGGEPAMHDLSVLTKKLQEKGLRTHIETSGVYPLTGTWDWITFSPKKFKRPQESIYRAANELKVIVYHHSDLEWALEHAHKTMDSCQWYLQAEWERREEMNTRIISFLRTHPKWKLSVQIHKYIGID